MTKPTKPKGPDVPSPDRSADVPDPSRYDSMQVLQALIEIQRDVTSISVKTERLITDVNDLEGKVEKVSSALVWAKGFAAAAAILIPVCFAVIWWLIGGQLSSIRDQLLSAMPKPSAAVAPAKQDAAATVVR